MNKQTILKTMRNGGFKIVDHDGWNDYFISEMETNKLTKDAKVSKKVWLLARVDAGKIIQVMDSINERMVDTIQDFESVTIERGKLCYNFRRFDGFTTKIVA